MPASKIILASGSPRRRQLLGAAGITFDVIESGIAEKHAVGEAPRDYALRMAREKARAVSIRAPHAIVVGADTIVVCDAAILEKPGSPADARRMLTMLSGRTHIVITAFAIARDGAIRESAALESRVTFRTLAEAEIDEYIATGEPFDKAGAYGIQGLGGGFISHLEGSRDNVMGLPTEQVVAALTRQLTASEIDFSKTRSNGENEMATRLRIVRERIATAARRAHRDPASIRLVLASKTQGAPAIRAAYEAGARDFGENYVQEALSKRAELRDLDIRWHLIGHLQSNKARLAAPAFALIHSIDSTRLVDALARSQSSPRVRGLIEVNLGAEVSKTGVALDAVANLLDASRDKVEIVGLMTIPPHAATPELARPYFARLREMRDRFAIQTGLALSELSMGMTDDFEIAIEEGATIVRVGRAVFGERAS
jgi:PLP dependent protein